MTRKLISKFSYLCCCSMFKKLNMKCTLLDMYKMNSKFFALDNEFDTQLNIIMKKNSTLYKLKIENIVRFYI